MIGASGTAGVGCLPSGLGSVSSRRCGGVLARWTDMAKRTSGVTGSTAGSDARSVAQRTVEEYLNELRAIRASGAGVAEISYYPALANLFNAVGKTLKPRVRCVMNLKQQGAGMPDGGLFTADQFRRQAEGPPAPDQLPARGAIEVKSTKPGVEAIAASQQVRDYLRRYGIVVVTNLREFLIVERGPGGGALGRESYALADGEEDFWRDKVAHPRATAERRGEAFVEFLRRACLHAAPLVNPKDVAWFLASYARDGLRRVEERKDLAALQAIRVALEDALGMKFTGEKGEHFFRSTLVQTLFYGVFSAWVRWHKDKPGPQAKFDWRTAEWCLHVPFIRTLYEEIAKASRLGPLGLVEVLNWAAGVLNRVDRGEFFSRFEDEHAVQYFYEPFLEAYDPELRKALGVWYTPREIVRYQVARVDQVLREELALPDGLADPNVVVLDPCCGTGAYLVEVLTGIANTLRDKGGDALVASDLKQAAMHRVFGFEILPAPFVVSHLQLGLMLQAQGAPLSHEAGERVGVYLTNALTGWEPPKGPKQHLMHFIELEQERDAAEQVKRDKKILVVLGNPPYNAFAGVSPEEEKGLVEPYKVNLNKPASAGGWGIRKFNLDDLYVRFFRLAERRIAEMSGEGVVSFISNFSYLGDPSFVVMRERFLSEFDKLWFDCLNGDSRETGKLTPQGKPDPSVFSTEQNREGIRVGTTVCVIVRKPKRDKKPTVRFRHFWGVHKRSDLLKSIKARNINRAYTVAAPSVQNRHSFRPENVAAHYGEWPSVVELCALPPSNGLMEKRGGALVDMDRDALEARMRDYFDRELDWDSYRARQTALTRNMAAFNAREARAKALATEGFRGDRICRYGVRPFDQRWCYYTGVNPVWNRARPALWAQLWAGNRFLTTRFRSSSDTEGHPFGFTSVLIDDHYIVPDAVAIPLSLLNGDRLSQRDQATLFDVTGDRPSRCRATGNLSKAARVFLSALRVKDPDADVDTAALVWMHALAIGYSPAYLAENADGIRRDWPRIPLPNDRKWLQVSATLGERVGALLNTEADVPGVTAGKVAPLFKSLGAVAKAGGGQLDVTGDHLLVTAGWGHKGKDGVTMPGKGRVVERQYSEAEAKALAAEATARGMAVQDVRRLLGEATLDVYLNETAYWRNIPLNVWNYYIGGYQVIKKWLSYREHDVLGRALKPEEAREVTSIARRIAAIILLQSALDENYHKVKAAPYAWARTQG